MAYVFYDFNQADGAPTGWSTAGGTDWAVVSNKGSTNNNTAILSKLTTHGISLAGDWEMNCLVNGSTTIGNGGATIYLCDGTAKGYSLFVGNSSHVQIRTAGGGNGGNLTNDARATRAMWMRWVYTATGGTGGNSRFDVYHDGVLTGGINDTTNVAMMNTATLCLVALQETTSPTDECTIDDLMISDTIGATYPPAAAYVRPQLVVPRVGVQRASRW